MCRFCWDSDSNSGVGTHGISSDSFDILNNKTPLVGALPLHGRSPFLDLLLIAQLLSVFRPSRSHTERLDSMSTPRNPKPRTLFFTLEGFTIRCPRLCGFSA
jgi:hypothetical protein